MKLTTTQLKKIIAEEVKKASINEASGDENFYAHKSEKLEQIIVHVESINDILYEIEMEESRAPGGDVSELQPLHDSLDRFEEEVTSLIDAVEAMV